MFCSSKYKIHVAVAFGGNAALTLIRDVRWQKKNKKKTKQKKNDSSVLPVLEVHK